MQHNQNATNEHLALRFPRHPSLYLTVPISHLETQLTYLAMPDNVLNCICIGLKSPNTNTNKN